MLLLLALCSSFNFPQRRGGEAGSKTGRLGKAGRRGGQARRAGEAGRKAGKRNKADGIGKAGMQGEQVRRPVVRQTGEEGIRGETLRRAGLRQAFRRGARSRPDTQANRYYFRPQGNATFERWKVMNGGEVLWRPYVRELLLFSDAGCQIPIVVPQNGGWTRPANECPASGCQLCSGRQGHELKTGCSLAIDGYTDTMWRPSASCNYRSGKIRPGCPAQSIWLEVRFARPTTVRCIAIKGDLAEGAAGDRFWWGGLAVNATNGDGPAVQLQTAGATLL